MQQYCPPMCVELVKENSEVVAVKEQNGNKIFAEESSICLSAIYSGINLELGAFLLVEYFEPDKPPTKLVPSNDENKLREYKTWADNVINIFKASEQNGVKTIQISTSTQHFVLTETEMFIELYPETTIDELIKYNSMFQRRWEKYQIENKYKMNPNSFKFTVKCINYPFKRMESRGKDLKL